MFFHDHERGGAEIPGAGVIAETLPCVENVAFRGCREGSEIGETAEPVIIIRNDSGDLGLLEHELGDEDRVGVRRVAPGKIAAIFAIPGKKGATE